MSDASTDLQQRVHQLERVWYGDGEPGAAERMRNFERRLESLESLASRTHAALDRIEDERKAVANQWQGARKVFIIVSSIFGLGGGGIAIYVIRLLGKLAEQMP